MAPSPLKPLAAAALATIPVAAPQAASFFDATSPTISCKGTATESGRLDWPNGVSVDTPTFSYLGTDGSVLSSSPFDCISGELSTTVLGKKTKTSTTGDITFIKLVDKASPVLAKLSTSDPEPVKVRAIEQVVSGDGRFPVYETYWDVASVYDLLDPATGLVIGSSTNFIGFKYSSNVRFVGLSDVAIVYDSALGGLSFIAPAQDADGRMQLIPATVVPVPGAMGLFGSGLLGLGWAAARRRRLGW